MNAATLKHLTKLLLLSFILAACSPSAKLTNELTINKSKWQDAAISNYSIELRRVCFCPIEYVGPVQITVDNNTISSQIYTETQEPVQEDIKQYFPSIDGLFDLIDDAIKEQADEINISYHSEFGYPKVIDIDYLKDAVDDELTVRILSFNQP